MRKLTLRRCAAAELHLRQLLGIRFAGKPMKLGFYQRFSTFCMQRWVHFVVCAGDGRAFTVGFSGRAAFRSHLLKKSWLL